MDEIDTDNFKNPETMKLVNDEKSNSFTTKTTLIE